MTPVLFFVISALFAHTGAAEEKKKETEEGALNKIEAFLKTIEKRMADSGGKFIFGDVVSETMNQLVFLWQKKYF